MHPSRISVLDKGWVELVDMMPYVGSTESADMAIVHAARTSYEIEEKVRDIEDDKKLLFYLYRNRHTTPFEMAQMKFRVKLPLFVRDQWVRHRTWSFDIQSFRYSEPAMDFYYPDKWRRQSHINKQDSYGSLTSAEEASIVDSLWATHLISSGTLQKENINAVLDEYIKTGIGIYKLLTGSQVAREMARMFIPINAYTTMIANIDAHNLLKFLRLRMDKHAQWEIRQYANTIYENFFKKHLPWTAEAYEAYG